MPSPKGNCAFLCVFMTFPNEKLCRSIFVTQKSDFLSIMEQVHKRAVGSDRDRDHTDNSKNAVNVDDIRHLSYLLSQIPRVNFGLPSKAYPQKPRPLKAEPTPHLYKVTELAQEQLNEVQQWNSICFAHLNEQLGEQFSLQEFKRLRQQLIFSLHPDQRSKSKSDIDPRTLHGVLRLSKRIRLWLKN